MDVGAKQPFWGFSLLVIVFINQCLGREGGARTSLLLPSHELRRPNHSLQSPATTRRRRRSFSLSLPAASHTHITHHSRHHSPPPPRRRQHPCPNSFTSIISDCITFTLTRQPDPASAESTLFLIHKHDLLVIYFLLLAF